MTIKKSPPSAPFPYCLYLGFVAVSPVVRKEKQTRRKKGRKGEKWQARAKSGTSRQWTSRECDTTKGRQGGEGAVTLNSVWIRPRALFVANFSARCRFVQRFYRRIEKIRMLSIFPSPSFLPSRFFFCFHRDAMRKKVSRRENLVVEVSLKKTPWYTHVANHF